MSEKVPGIIVGNIYLPMSYYINTITIKLIKKINVSNNFSSETSLRCPQKSLYLCIGNQNVSSKNK